MLNQCSRRCELNSISIVIVSATTVHSDVVGGLDAIETAVLLEPWGLSTDLLGGVVSAAFADLLDFLVEVMQSHDDDNHIDEA
jgi:hypothetical protein